MIKGKSFYGLVVGAIALAVSNPTLAQHKSVEAAVLALGQIIGKAEVCQKKAEGADAIRVIEAVLYALTKNGYLTTESADQLFERARGAAKATRNSWKPGFLTDTCSGLSKDVEAIKKEFGLL